jgi:hypothetical protein
MPPLVSSRKTFSLPDSALAQAACDGSKLTAIDVIVDVGRGRDWFVCLIFILLFDIQAKSLSEATHFACAHSIVCCGRARDHDIDEVNRRKIYRPIRCIRLSLNLIMGQRGRIDVD